MKVIVKTPTGDVIIDAEPSDTVENLKRRIEDEAGIAIDQQLLLFAGKVMNDGRGLSEYGIQKESKIYLRLRNEPRAGPLVNAVARHELHCANSASLSAVESPVMRLGPFDTLVLPFIPVAVVWVYPPPLDEPFTEVVPVPRLLRALARLLDYYPHLTGRIQVNPGDRTPEIVRVGSGALLVEATCSASLASFVGADGRHRVTDLPDGGNALLAPYDPSMDAVCREPFFTVQHTRFACGSVALGMRVPHVVCDADGYFQLFRDLCELYRGFRTSEAGPGEPSVVSLSQPPHVTPFLRELYDMSADEKAQALQFHPPKLLLTPLPAEVPASPETDATPAPATSPAAPVVGRVLRFSGPQLNALKSAATSGDGWVSTFDALAAHLFQRVYSARVLHARNTGADPRALSTDFLTPVNWRGAGRLGMPPNYFGNALFCAYFTADRDELATGSLAAVAASVHDAVRGLSREDAMDSLKWVAAQPDKSRIGLGFRYTNGGFMLSQWCKFGMYASADLDVDARGERVAPYLVMPPFTPISLMDGLGYILATEEQLAGDGGAGAQSVDVALALAEPLWAILDGDSQFLLAKRDEESAYELPSSAV